MLTGYPVKQEDLQEAELNAIIRKTWRVQRIATLVLLISAATVVAGGVKVNVGKGGAVSVEVPGVNVRVGDAASELPADFPADVLQYPGWKLGTVVDNGSGSTRVTVVTARSLDTTAEVLEAYESSAKKQGWIRTTIDMTLNEDGHGDAEVTFEKEAEKRTMSLEIDGDEDSTSISLSLTPTSM